MKAHDLEYLDMIKYILYQLHTTGYTLFIISAYWSGCNWKYGKGSGGHKQYIGYVTGPLQCINKCEAKTYEGVKAVGSTVDAKTGKLCYCEYNMRTSYKSKEWKTCFFFNIPGMFAF